MRLETISIEERGATDGVDVFAGSDRSRNEKCPVPRPFDCSLKDKVHLREHANRRGDAQSLASLPERYDVCL